MPRDMPFMYADDDRRAARRPQQDDRPDHEPLVDAAHDEPGQQGQEGQHAPERFGIAAPRVVIAFSPARRQHAQGAAGRAPPPAPRERARFHSPSVS